MRETIYFFEGMLSQAFLSTLHKENHVTQAKQSFLRKCNVKIVVVQGHFSLWEYAREGLWIQPVIVSAFPRVEKVIPCHQLKDQASQRPHVSRRGILPAHHYLHLNLNPERPNFVCLRNVHILKPHTQSCAVEVCFAGWYLRDIAWRVCSVDAGWVSHNLWELSASMTVYCSKIDLVMSYENCSANNSRFTEAQLHACHKTFLSTNWKRDLSLFLDPRRPSGPSIQVEDIVKWGVWLGGTSVER